MTTDRSVLAVCPGCGLPSTGGDLGPHPYILASANCWETYGRLLAREYAEWRTPLLRLAIDTYAAQHPGTMDRRARQSVAVHLVGMHLALHRGADADLVLRETRSLLRRVRDFPSFRPPAPDVWSMTVVTPAECTTRAAYTSAVTAWASSVWATWERHAPEAAAWARDCCVADPGDVLPGEQQPAGRRRRSRDGGEDDGR